MSSWIDPLTPEEIAQRKQNERRRRSNVEESQWARDCKKEGRPEKKHPEKGRKRAKLSLWHKFILLLGYAALLYGVAKGIVYILVWLEAAT